MRCAPPARSRSIPLRNDDRAIADCGEALQASDTLLKRLMASLCRTLQQADADESRALQFEQSRAHGVAWAATYVRALQQILA